MGKKAVTGYRSLEVDLEVDFRGGDGGGLQRGLQRGIQTGKRMGLVVKLRSGQVWFRLQLKFNSLELVIFLFVSLFHNHY